MHLRPDNPMAKALLSVLVFEAVCFALAVPGMIQVSELAVELAMGLGIAGAVLALAAAVTLNRVVGYPLGWLTQIAVVACGIAIPMMFFVGGLFALIWVVSFVLGKRIEAARA